ncbi:hypothetical protein GWC95_15135 [Sediminibacterium roseum]|uniref:HEAT repeat-containing protein n=1 Tax=Sediminibacterium roseum TaxID=1978412 RepID=A0ABW9ZVU5_9BACT|nr:hypothetical protein [Sediminibacterium roseum]NCI51266.1 hypothetical protein [Sediminibacterium roseum]
MGPLLSADQFPVSLTKYISTNNLAVATVVLAIGIGAIVCIIYFYLYFKKRIFFTTHRISRILEQWISAIIMEESPESIVMPGRFYRMMEKPVAKQFVIDELVNAKKNFSGSVALNIVALYQQLGLKAVSLKKLRSKGWHIKAKGIQELYMMDQHDALTRIYKNTNSRNEYVRMEAQTGVIHLTGFQGLRFLDVISYPITEWQQLKLLEQLRLSQNKADFSDKLQHWLRSKNDTVVVFALKLADEYQQFDAKENVMGCLVHPSAQVREQALKTLVRLSDDRTAGILLGYFTKETESNQAYILDALVTLASENEKTFLSSLLEHPRDQVKLKAAIVLAKCCSDGLALVEKKAAMQPEPYRRILLHVQSVA